MINQQNLFTARRSRTVHHLSGTHDTTLTIPVFKPQTLGVQINGKFCRVLALPNGASSIRLFSQPNTTESLQEIIFDRSIDKYLTQKGLPIWNSSDGPWKTQVDRLQQVYDAKLELLQNYRRALPEWFIEYELENINLDYWEDMYLTDAYRRGMLNLDDSMPTELLQFLDTLSLVRNGPFLTSNFLTLAFAKIASPQIKSGNWYREFTVQDRFRYVIENLSTYPRPIGQKIAVQLYIRMIIGAREFPDELKQRVLSMLDLNHKGLLDLILETKESIIGRKAGDFVLETTKGSFVERSDFTGKPVYISFWFTGCKPCIKAFPAENRLVEKFSESDLQFIRICTNSRKEDWLELIKKHGLKAQNLFANMNWSKILAGRYNVESYPKYILVDRSGIIVSENELSPDGEKIVDKLSAVL